MGTDGNNALPPLLQMPAQKVSPQQAIEILESTLGPAITIVMKGVQASFPFLPAPLVMLAACRVLGHLVGGTFSGANAPLAPLMKARRDCQDMFEKAMREIPLTHPSGGTGPLPGISSPPDLGEKSN